MRPLQIIVLLTALASSSLRAQPCTPYLTGMPWPQIAGVQAIFDDGSGPAMYTWFSGQVHRWDGYHWVTLSSGMPQNDVGSVVVLDDGGGPKLYAIIRGTFSVGGWTSRVWTNGAWVPGPPGLVTQSPTLGEVGDAPVYSFDDGSGPAIYGRKRVSGSHILPARWDGSQWVQLGDSVPTSKNLIYIGYDDGTGPALYAAGVFSWIAGVPARNMARWDGTTWQPLGAGPIASSFNGVKFIQNGPAAGLYFLGDGLQKWDGQEWSLLPGPDPPLPGHTPYYVASLEVFDDGRGPAIYLGGNFKTIGGLQVNGLARWDGSAWSAVADNITGTVWRMKAFHEDPRGPSLFIYGPTVMAGGQTPSEMSRLIGCPNCYANCDNSTIPPILNIEDFTCFIRKFAVQDPYANCNQDNVINVDDFLCFLNKFAQGCP